jgi:hypothetical protein
MICLVAALVFFLEELFCKTISNTAFEETTTISIFTESRMVYMEEKIRSVTKN